MGFGRRKMDITYNEAKCYLKYQIGALKALVEAENLQLQHVFLHGALNGVAGKDKNIAMAIVEGIKEIDHNLIFLHRPKLKSYECAKKLGLRVATVIGIDTEYTLEGLAVPQRKKKSIEPEDAAKKAVMLVKDQKVKTVSGSYRKIRVDSILVHGDTPNSIQILKKIHSYFEDEQIQISNLKEIIDNK
jgi:UPF0271 protein